MRTPRNSACADVSTSLVVRESWHLYLEGRVVQSFTRSESQEETQSFERGYDPVSLSVSLERPGRVVRGDLRSQAVVRPLSPTLSSSA